MEHHLPDRAIGHETRDAGVRVILVSGAVLAVVVSIVGALMYGTFRYLEIHRATTPANPMATRDSLIPPVPRIEEHPALGMQELRTQEDRTLSTYGWTDKKTGIVRIPLDRAMELQLQRGFPTKKAATK